ncbi:MAG: phosphoenolpyruvate carboxykinase [Methylocystis sp.]|uniref:phosphoenolpyruvate carboxykinase n=1 Tax=Methylocystis sp. TaxID=1911079 RepID=UPI003D1321D3
MWRTDDVEDAAIDALDPSTQARRNWGTETLYPEAVRRGEGVAASTGGLVVETGAHTGRSPNDKFIVRDSLTDSTIWWDNNLSMRPEHFVRLHHDMMAHARGANLFSQDLYACAAPTHRLNVRVHTEYAWHSLFARHLFTPAEGVSPSGFQPQLTVLDLPSFRADPSRHGCRSSTVIAIDFSSGVVLIGGTQYAGEIKKAIFTYLNYVLPAKGVLPMHCAVNDGEGGSAVFFGLSGTGKTTLSADPARNLIGDDEHGWDENGLFNFEGGCYAKAIRLSQQSEPDIFAASHRRGAILENVSYDPDAGRFDFDDDSRTENTRIAYPLDFIPNASATRRAGHPRNVVMLTCDAFGVLPPIARLTPAQAMYHFLSGYTAKVAGTERGVEEPQATFSACFGAPFMPRRPTEYANLLRDFICSSAADCWLVNTGWSGGPYGVGRRMPIAATRALLQGALDGSLAQGDFRTDRTFGLSVPASAPGVDSMMLDPVQTWSSSEEFDRMATRLIGMFEENFRRMAPLVDRQGLDAHPGRVR